MRFKPQNYKAVFIMLVAIAGLVACLVFTVARLLYVEADLKSEDNQTNLWQITQAQFEATLVSESLARTAANDTFTTPEQEPNFRFAILISRLAVLLEGPHAELIERIGMMGSLKQHYLQITLAEPLLELPLDPQAALQLRAQTRELAYELRDIANKVLLMSREHGARTRSMYLRAVFESLAFIVGIVITASFLLLRLFKGMQEANQARRLLRQEQELSDLVINNISNQGIVIFDDRLNCLLWNPGMEELLGVRPDNTVGQNLQTLDPLFAHPGIVSALTQAVAGTSSIREYEAIADGQEKCLEVSCFPLTLAERQLGIAFVRDVTEQWQARKQAERQTVDLEMKVLQRTAALQQAEQRLIAAVEAAPDGFAAFDAQGELLFANERIRAAEPVTVWCAEDMNLCAFLRCFAICEGADERLVSDEVPNDEIELDLLVKRDVWARLSVTQAKGGIIFVRLVDISAYKHAARALQSALDRERETTGAYRSFVSMVSHQFRTPLAILDSSAQRILRRGQDASHDELVVRVQKIRSATSRLTRLVDSVLNAAKLDAGRIELNPASCDLNELVRDICERQREVSSHADIRIDAPDLPINVHCDSILIEQVVVNLLSNAVKYSGETPLVEVKVWIDGSRAYCSIRDWGLGIPSDEVGKIFDRFYRARTATGIAGTGIGLNFAQKIMHLHGGEINVESYEAGGSIFTFDLPVSNADQAQQAA
ncbi:sensor histidine kinase [Microvirga brassicacearum]|uniref:histidine kinase n=1 Tax=Microvirga brassicacearum TaxID=2580413 RepID=A0A5N3P8P4_9HYPH|nr:ATP-binding protein [Microvirga brassicacearum]KAB0266088.1 PAS domain S-box protein [Microvirga brassicacearum]